MTAPVRLAQRTPPVRPLAAFLEGWRRVVRAPVVFLATWLVWTLSWHLVKLALSMPAATDSVILRVPVFSNPWLALLSQQLEQLSYAAAPELMPFFAKGPTSGLLWAAMCAQALLWLFLSGGILDRYARGRPVGTAAFFAACGVYFVRFLRLAVIVAVIGYVIWRTQQAFAASPYVYTGLLILVGILGLIVDFAKVRSVVEDRHSMIGSLAASSRFVRRRPWRVLALGLLNALAVLAVVRIQYQILLTPASPWIAEVLWTALLLLGILVRLAFLASEVVFFQGELAHAGYTAAPIPKWPDSAAAEAMQNLVERSGLRNGPSS
jgi:hypothetical protein